MANITLYSNLHGWSFDDFWSIDFDSASILKATSSTLAGYFDGAFVAATGSFTIDGGELAGGTIRNLSFSVGGDSLAVISGLSLDVDDLASSSPSWLEQNVFNRADILTSSWNGSGSYATGGGDDRISLGAGDDIVDGGAGLDTFVLGLDYEPDTISLIDGAVVIDSALGHDRLTGLERIEFTDRSISVQVGGAGRDILRGDSDASSPWDILFGGAGDDRLAGRRGNDRLFGGDGDDRLIGGARADHLDGGDGADILRGGGGRDRLIGGGGDDILTGGAGRDTFVFTPGDGHDRITDFQLGIDTIAIADGVSGLADLDFVQDGSDVQISFADVTITVEDITLADLRTAGNFDF